MSGVHTYVLQQSLGSEIQSKFINGKKMKNWPLILLFFESLFTCECDCCLYGSPQVVIVSLLTTGDISQCILGMIMGHLSNRKQQHSRMLFKRKKAGTTQPEGEEKIFFLVSIVCLFAVMLGQTHYFTVYIASQHNASPF